MTVRRLERLTLCVSVRGSEQAHKQAAELTCSGPWMETLLLAELHAPVAELKDTMPMFCNSHMFSRGFSMWVLFSTISVSQVASTSYRTVVQWLQSEQYNPSLLGKASLSLCACKLVGFPKEEDILR